jgi:hypothetical protein
MAGTPEVLQPETRITERAEEFPETIQQIQGAKVVQKTFKAQVTDDKGKPIIQTPPAQVITVSPPSDSVTLTKQAKGDTTSALTWLAAFWLRVIKRAMYFGWKLVGKEQNVS